MNTSELYPDHLYFESPEAHANCSRLLISMGHNDTSLSEIENPCLYLWNTRMLDTMGVGGVDGAEFHMFTTWWPQLLVQCLYGIVCLIGLAGNTLVIYVVVRFSKMQTVTNLYIVNLAIADECFLVGIPFLMTTATLGYWPFGNIVCKAYFTSTSINQITSSMFLLIMSADRYLAVCHPISAPKWRTPLIAKTVALTAWTLSALLMVPIFMYANTLEIDNKVNCNIFWPESGSLNMSGEMIFIIYSFVLGFAIPLFLILVFYILVIRRLRSVGPRRQLNQSPNVTKTQTDNQQAQQQSTRTKERKKSHRKVTKLVLTVITVYFLCWAPYWGSQLSLIFMAHESSHSGTVLIIFLLAGCLSYSNSTMNPILYGFLSSNFKKSFKKACSCASRKEINATLNPENSVFPRRKSQSSGHRPRKCSAPLTSATYAGTTLETTTMTTRSSMLPSPHHQPLPPLQHHVIPDVDESSSENNVMTAVLINNGPSSSATQIVPPTPTVHITINDHFVPDDNFRIRRPVASVLYSGNGKSSNTIGTVNETFVQDNGVVVTVL
ncbi:somatostatin receptor type 5 [Folsomia candida]|uniref:somatostatin receptor type 5 n=1 Tax=Folsomia candida TaxID=158441 RepID=UPI001604EF0B|nr:somatostatin receptor type 5 [Folsomia candida]XP_035704902.1 somatostatin receptor type 5 [Folsomia candida]